jgi:hypothetical protein
MENLPYIYHPEKIKVIGIVPYPMLAHIMKKCNRKKRIYLTTIWLNSMVHRFDDLSYKEIYMMVKCWNVDLEYLGLDDQYILDTLKSYNPNKPHFYINTHFEWNMVELYKKLGNKKNVDDYKKSIRNKYSRMKVHNSKSEMVLNLYKNNQNIRLSEIMTYLNKNVSKPTINKVLRENNIVLEKKSKSFILIENRLEDLFKYRIDNVKSKLTLNLLAEYIGVNLKTINRFLIAYPEYKLKIGSFNKSL